MAAGARCRRALLAASLACLAVSGVAAPPGPSPSPAVRSPVSAIDDAGNRVSLPAPARRIVSLAPHVTELLYAAGAGGRVVGASDYSDYPPAARAIPSVGGAASIDIERIVALRPDLIVAWRGGNAPAQIAMLRRLGLPVFESAPQRLEDIASSMERLGRLAGTPATAVAAARAFRDRLHALAERYRDRSPVTVFYQVWGEPLMTFGGDSLIAAAARSCGGVNAFAALAAPAPTVSVEAVVARNPEAIFLVGDGGNAPDGWRRFPDLPAVARGNLFALPADWASRPGPRILDAAEAICRDLDLARSRRPARD
ncbi:MAG: cobalamin-binding protein [Burkholderiaceae bacterium]